MPEILVASRDYEATLAENIALKERLRLIECNRDMGLFVRLLELLKGFKPGQTLWVGDRFVTITNELIARANEGKK